MSDSIDPRSTDKPLERCSECDRETDHYNVFVTPSNEKSVICWECLSRGEKGFNAARGFSRDSRRGVIPR